MWRSKRAKPDASKQLRVAAANTERAPCVLRWQNCNNNNNNNKKKKNEKETRIKTVFTRIVALLAFHEGYRNLPSASMRQIALSHSSAWPITHDSWLMTDSSHHWPKHRSIKKWKTRRNQWMAHLFSKYWLHKDTKLRPIPPSSEGRELSRCCTCL